MPKKLNEKEVKKLIENASFVKIVQHYMNDSEEYQLSLRALVMFINETLEYVDKKKDT